MSEQPRNYPKNTIPGDFEGAEAKVPSLAELYSRFINWVIRKCEEPRGKK